MDLEAQTLTNTKDISELTSSVKELATMLKYEAERMKDDRSGVKDMVSELKGLNEKITSMGMVQKEMAQNSKDVTELRTRVDQLKEWKDKYDLSRMDSRIAALESTNQQEAGAVKAISTGADWFWRLFGPAISALAVAGCAYYFSHTGYYAKESTYIERGTHGKITGE